MAELYGIATELFNQPVRRNLDRFPEDFMFRLTKAEPAALRSQTVTLEKGRGRYSGRNGAGRWACRYAVR